MSAYYEDDRAIIYHGDCIEVLRSLPDNSVDSVVTDPPYALNFMGKKWDNFAGVAVGACEECGGDDAAEGLRVCIECAERLDEEILRSATMLGHQSQNWNEKATHSRGYADNNNAAFQRWCQLWAIEALRVLKPGGHLLAFGGTRTWHRLAVAIEDAGFEVRDSIAWMYGSGFPKSLDVSKAIDKAAGAQREPDTYTGANGLNAVYGNNMGGGVTLAKGQPATPAAQQWQGWGTALKPAFEPIVVARKPLIGTVAENVLAHGTGGLNIDGCRVGTTVETWPSSRNYSAREMSRPGSTLSSDAKTQSTGPAPAGRWPANVILDESQAAELDKQSGVTTTKQPAGVVTDTRDTSQSIGAFSGAYERQALNDSGGASRFFYCAKAGKKERPNVDGVAHPTVKPLKLMEYLCRLVTPPGGTILEPFAGSGTTIEAALNEGFNVIGIEMTDEYLPLIMARIERHGEKLC